MAGSHPHSRRILSEADAELLLADGRVRLNDRVAQCRDHLYLILLCDQWLQVEVRERTVPGDRDSQQRIVDPEIRERHHHFGTIRDPELRREQTPRPPPR